MEAEHHHDSHVAIETEAFNAVARGATFQRKNVDCHAFRGAAQR